MDSQDRVLLAGYSNQGATYYDFAVARLTTAGVLDTSFDGDGLQTFDFGYSEMARGVAVDSQDRVLVAGESYQGATSYDFTVLRLTTAGVLDGSFDGDGLRTIDFGNNQSDYAYGVAVDSQDRVLVAGYSYQGVTSNDIAVARSDNQWCFR